MSSIAIKPGGAVIAERGIAGDLPLGAHQPWAANIQASVAKLDQEWVVKLIIPRASMGAAGKEQLWGVNFTRYACQGGEASSWAPVARYFYDPRNLGSMILAGSPQAPAAAMPPISNPDRP